MTAHDGLGSVRADRRSDLEAHSPARSTAAVDVTEGRKLLTAYRSLDGVSPTYSDLHRWLFANASALLDAAEERDALRADYDGLMTDYDRSYLDRDRLRAELAALKKGIKALADRWAAEDDTTHWGTHEKSRCAHDLRALLNGADQ